MPKHSHIAAPTTIPLHRFGGYIPTLCGRRVGLLSLYSGYRSAVWKEAPLCPKCVVAQLLAEVSTPTSEEERDG
jgi:hypothetical protein